MILQACSRCDRQYDVTHLAVGNRIRCVCDEKLTVSRPKILTVRARKCTNCGGRVEPGEVACSYCASELFEPDLSSTLCPRCFARLDESAKHCVQCGTQIAPQALTALREGQSCPRCKSELCVRALGEASVVECTACAGTWVTTETFEGICGRAQDRPEVKLGGIAEPSVAAAAPERKVTYIPCLTCGEMMLRRNFRYRNAPSHVIVDYCKRHGVWLDASELERIVAFIRSSAGDQRSFDSQSSLGSSRSRRAPPPMPMGSSRSDRYGWGLEWFLGGMILEVLSDLFD